VSDWRERAACRGRDPTWWFGSPFEQAVALRVCASCPVRIECLYAALVEEDGLRAAERFGVRGGMVPDQRARMTVNAVGTAGQHFGQQTPSHGVTEPSTACQNAPTFTSMFVTSEHRP
jgi:Transcription factor WhiB